MRKAKVLVLFYSMYGHMHRMAEAAAEGARSAGAEVHVMQVPETLAEEVLKKMMAFDSKKAYTHIPIARPEDLEGADAVIWGVPTRYGGAPAQVRAFIDRLGGLWMRNALVGKVGSVMSGSGTQHGGQETTILTMHISLLHLGNVIVGLPYSENRQSTMEEISGGSPYGASTITGQGGDRMPSENELKMAMFQGRHVAEIAKKLAGV
jgi:NAD(P)H dehydrogenase (quinone)